MTDQQGPPETYWQYKARVEKKLAWFNGLGLSRYTDGATQWAEYAAYQQEQHREWLKYERAHYPVLTHDQGMRQLAHARLAVVTAERGVDEEQLEAAVHQLEVINYELWNTPFTTTAQQVKDRTADLSDPFQSLRDSITDAQGEVDRFQKQVDQHVRSTPPAVELLNEAQIQLDAARARLAAALG